MPLGGSRAPLATALRPWLPLGALTLGAALVFWVFDALPFMDLPAHAGLIAMRQRFVTSPFEQHFYVFDPHVGPYSVFRFLGDCAARVIGPVGAVRLLATLPMIATPLALVYARRRLHGDRSLAFGYLGIVLSFNLMTIFGFASYLLGVAALVVALTMWLELMAAVDERRPTPRRELALACMSLLVLLTHGYAFVLYVCLAGVTAIATGDRMRRILRVRCLAPALALAAYDAWIERSSTMPQGSVASTHDDVGVLFQSAFDKVSLLITPTLMTRSGVDAAIGVALWVTLLVGLIMTLRTLRGDGGTVASAARAHVRALLACIVALAAAFLVLPHMIGWFGFVDGRLVLVVMLLGLMSVRREALRPWLDSAIERLSPVAAVVTIALAFVASYRFQGEALGYKRVLSQVPPYSRLLNLPLDPNSEYFTGHPFVHYDQLALAERPMLVSDLWLHQGSAIFARPVDPGLRLPSSYVAADLRGVDWPAYHLEDWDYVLIRTRPAALSPETPSALGLVAHEGGWWLYRSSVAVPLALNLSPRFE
jgi:hypothetical protein